MTYVVHYRLDDVRGTPGRCKTDHALVSGDVIYAGQGRAIVRSCREDRATAQPLPARTQAALARLTIVKE